MRIWCSRMSTFYRTSVWTTSEQEPLTTGVKVMTHIQLIQKTLPLQTLNCKHAKHNGNTIYPVYKSFIGSFLTDMHGKYLLTKTIHSQKPVILNYEAWNLCSHYAVCAEGLRFAKDRVGCSYKDLVNSLPKLVGFSCTFFGNVKYRLPDAETWSDHENWLEQHYRNYIQFTLRGWKNYCIEKKVNTYYRGFCKIDAIEVSEIINLMITHATQKIL